MKNTLLTLLGLLLLAACEKEPVLPAVAEADQTIDLRAKTDKITVCHHSANEGIWKLKDINENAWPEHEAHGDVRLDDQDDDGFVPDNECDFGQEGDCDDNNAAVNPGATEVCDNSIDDDCDGDVDEADSDCVCGGGLLEVAIDPDGTLGNGDEYTLYVHPMDQRTGYPQTNGVQWGGYKTDIPGLDNKYTTAAALADFDGAANTQVIVDFLGDGDYAAKVCADLEYNGCDDWYLPATGELKAMVSQLGGIGNNNFDGYHYWSSTEHYSYNAWFQLIYIYNPPGSMFKSNGSLGCRCVRR